MNKEEPFSHTYSQILTKDNILSFVANNEYVDLNGRNMFLISENPKKQQFITRFLKSFVNTADILEYEEKYYSVKTNEQSLKRTEKMDEALYVDILILRFLFNDFDHRLKYLDNKYYNVKVFEDKKYYLFDFGKLDFWRKVNNERMLEILNKLNIEQRQYMQKVLKSILDLYSSVVGKELMDSIVTYSKKEICEIFERGDSEKYDVEFFRTELLNRVQNMLNIISKDK